MEWWRRLKKGDRVIVVSGSDPSDLFPGFVVLKPFQNAYGQWMVQVTLARSTEPLVPIPVTQLRDPVFDSDALERLKRRLYAHKDPWMDADYDPRTPPGDPRGRFGTGSS